MLKITTRFNLVFSSAAFTEELGVMRDKHLTQIIDLPMDNVLMPILTYQ